MNRKLSDIKFRDKYHTLTHNINKGDTFITETNKIYKVLGIEVKTFTSVDIYAVRLLKRTFKPSRKQPLFEVFRFEDFSNGEVILNNKLVKINSF